MESKLVVKAGIIAFTTAIGYVLIGYFTQRTQFVQLLLLHSFVFGLYLWLVKLPITYKSGLFLALFFRSIFLFATPALSDDFYRFIWDGTLVANGQNPFLHLPSYYAENQFAPPGLTPFLFQKLNSPDYFSVYPPVCQFIFGVANAIGGDSIWLNCLVMRLFIFAAETGSLFLMLKLLPLVKLPVKQIWWYAFNPLVIVELTGNLHFEGILIFFLLLSLFLLLKNKRALSAIAFALAVAVKLWPLMFLPFLLKSLKIKAFLFYATIVGFLLTLLFAPFLSIQLLHNILNSVNLYFQKFEFNASVYYVLRWLGYHWRGYNEIAYIGRFLSLATFIGIITLAFKRSSLIPQQLPYFFTLAVSIYLFLATIVHPWYITPLVALATCTHWRYPIVWSGVVIVSYATYTTQLYKENLYLVALEYFIVFTVLFLETRKVINLDKDVIANQ
ncbi:hypothetical protein [Adhaeribacter aquaticus]|uniref:hypothetical protein n=1 Tax=Adhaeribacter aquaticus TaxID=299567 RepID=UPI00041F33AF|nr:hypothetical protein [Adhaeribacter aquaticus]